MNKEEYKTFEELKEELGDKFEEYMYGANVNLLNNWNELKKWLEEEIKRLENINFPDDFDRDKKLIYKNVLSKMQELKAINKQVEELGW